VKSWAWGLLVLFLSGAACKRSGATGEKEAKDASAEAQQAVSKQDQGPKLVKVTAETAREAHIATGPAEERRLTATLDLNGQIVPDPDAIALLSARSSGRVVKVLAREGDHVRAGQVVIVVSSPDLARLRGEYAAASAKAAAARQNARRLRALVEERLGAEQDAISAFAEAAAAEATRDATARTIRGMGAPLAGGEDPSVLQIGSPISGQIIQRSAAPGQAVASDNTLATVADLSRIWFQAQLFEKDLARVREGAPADLRLGGYPEVVFPAKVARIAAQVDPQTRALTVRLAVQDEGHRLRLGLYGTAAIAVVDEEDEPHVVVPASAVTEIGQRKAVFVRRAGNEFEMRPVRTGKETGGQIALLAGVRPGEEVVVSGVHSLKSMVLRSTLGEEE
jgi:cobalt-zinc-cadmium efflux system membrane fusion protein